MSQGRDWEITDEMLAALEEPRPLPKLQTPPGGETEESQRRDTEVTQGREGERESQRREKKQVGIYPWKLWSDGEFHVAVRGADFECTTGDFQNRLHNYARRKELYVLSETLAEGTVEFCFFKTKEERGAVMGEGLNTEGL